MDIIDATSLEMISCNLAYSGELVVVTKGWSRGKKEEVES